MRLRPPVLALKAPATGGELAALGLLLVVTALLGLAVGSFLTVVVGRVPAGESIVRPRSHCPPCGHAIRARDNIPVLSWLLLRGRCRDCGTPISARYLLLELLTAVLFVAVVLRFGLSSFTPVALVVVAASLALAAIDLEHQRLPFPVTGAALLGAGALLVVDATASGGGWGMRALLSVAAWGAVYGGLWLVTLGAGMGLGDVALAPLYGLVLGRLGWGSSLVGLGAGFLVGAVIGIALIASRRAGRRARVPHGPFMVAGALVGLFAGEPLADLYLSATGLAR